MTKVVFWDNKIKNINNDYIIMLSANCALGNDHNYTLYTSLHLEL